VLKAVAFVALGTPGLFFFFDFVDELQGIANPDSLGYGAPQRCSTSPC
jgi:lipopolysaccharide export system permease protein